MTSMTSQIARPKNAEARMIPMKPSEPRVARIRITQQMMSATPTKALNIVNVGKVYAIQ